MLRNLVAALALSFIAQSAVGLGLGSLQKSSALNEPFSAQIEIIGANATDFDTLTVKLADTEQFERAGVLRQALLLGLKFKPVSSRRGDHIEISSHQPIKEPFLNFLLELNWANGKMVREYTVLLDPPLYDPVRRPAPAPAPPSAPVEAMAPAREPAEPTPTPSYTSTTTTTPEPYYSSGDTIGPVTANDTLWRLAEAHRPADVSVQQMMMALFRANPEAFGNNNINFLKRGAILRMPDYDEMTGVSRGEAVAEARRHHQMWNDYRQGAASDVAEQPISTDSTVVDSSDDIMVEGDETSADSDARLELVAPDDEQQSATGGGSESGAASSLLQEQLDAKAQENQELRAKIGEADEIIDLMERQVEIKDEELAALQARLQELGIEDVDIMTGDAGTDDSAMPDEAMPEEGMVDDDEEVVVEEVVPDEVVADPEPQVDDGGEEPVVEDDGMETVAEAPVEKAVGFLDGLIPRHIVDMVPGGLMTILGGIAALLLLLFGGVIKWISGGREQDMPARTSTQTTKAVAEHAADAVEDTTASALETDTVEASAIEVTESFEDTLEATADNLTPAPADTAEPQEDPLEEVNVYLAYERFDQAEELVREVIASNPDEPKYRLRLLEVFYSSNDQVSYETEARNLLDAVGDTDPMWESALAMWGELSPERALFAEGGADLTAADTGSMKAFVDITSGAEEGGLDTVSMTPSAESNLEATAIGLTNEDDIGPVDFNLSQDDASIEADGTLDLNIATATDSDLLDLTSTSAGDNADIASDDDVFDLTAASDVDGVDTSGDEIFDLTETSEAIEEGSDIVDLTGATLGSLSVGDDDPLDLTTPSEATEHDLLDVTKTGDLGGDTSDELLDVTANNLADDDASGPDDTTVDFDISDSVADVFSDNTAGSEADSDNAALLDITGGDAETTLDFEIGGLEDTDDLAGSAAPDDMTLEFDGSSVADTSDLDIADTSDLTNDSDTADLPTMQLGAVEPDTGDDTVDFDLSLQSPELDELSDTTDNAPEGDAAIDFDLALEDTSDMDSIVIDETLELPKPSADDESLEDLTKSMEESMAELDLEMDSSDDDVSDLDLDLTIGELEVDDTVAIEAGSDLSQDDDLLNVDETLVLPEGQDAADGVDEFDTKLNLAKAYIELGDNDGARSILGEVAQDGSSDQKSEAQRLIEQMS